MTGSLASVKMDGVVSTAMVTVKYSFVIARRLIAISVCKTDDACIGFPLAGAGQDDDSEPASNMTCYKGGETVFNNHQMCDVTSAYHLYSHTRSSSSRASSLTRVLLSLFQ
jgi:hypothetical protein